MQILSKKRDYKLELTEERLHLWIENQVTQGAELSAIIVRTKAKSLYDHICKETKQPGEFVASPGWLFGFKKRSGVKSVRMVGESAEVPQQEVDKFKEKFVKIIRRGYTLDQVFNVDETGLFWKKRAGRTYTTKNKTNVPGQKPDKNRVTILLGKRMHLISKY